MAKPKKNEIAVLSPDAEIQHQVAVMTADYEAELQSVLVPGEVYDLSTMTARIKNMEGQAAFSLMEIGRMFRAIQIAEGTRFGQVVEELGRTTGYAYKMIALHAKLGTGGREKLLALGISKAIELITLEGSELDAIAAGSAVNGLTLDDVDKMSVREVRDAFRKARVKIAQEKETTDELVTKRDERIRVLQKAVDLGDKFPGTERASLIIADLAKACAELSAATKTIAARFDQYTALKLDHELPEDMDDMVRSMIHNAQLQCGEFEAQVGGGLPENISTLQRPKSRKG